MPKKVVISQLGGREMLFYMILVLRILAGISTVFSAGMAIKSKNQGDVAGTVFWCAWVLMLTGW